MARALRFGLAVALVAVSLGAIVLQAETTTRRSLTLEVLTQADPFALLCL